MSAERRRGEKVDESFSKKVNTEAINVYNLRMEEKVLQVKWLPFNEVFRKKLKNNLWGVCSFLAILFYSLANLFVYVEYNYVVNCIHYYIYIYSLKNINIYFAE